VVPGSRVVVAVFFKLQFLHQMILFNFL